MPTPIYIPARWAASRAPGKLLRTWQGEPVLRRVAGIARASALGPVVVLAADERILEAARGWGLEAVPVFEDVRNGSERIAAAISRGLVPRTEFALNLQGDAVGASPAMLRAALTALIGDPDATLGTVAVAATEGGGRTTVRVEGGRALAFDRVELRQGERVHRHVGVYAYRVAGLLERAAAMPGPLERRLSLEQLRWLEAGLPVAVAVVEGDATLADAVDTDADFGPATGDASGARAPESL